MLARVHRAAWRLDQVETERQWALASAQAEGVSIRKLASAAGLSAVHQLVTSTDLDAVDTELGVLRAAGWPAQEDPDSNEDEELSGRELLADRLADEVGCLRQCASWVEHLDQKTYPPAVNLRPEGDSPETCPLVIGLPRVAAVLGRIPYDLDELTRARRVDELEAAAVRDDPRAERRRRLAEPDLDFREFCRSTGTPAQSTAQGERAWTAYQAERRRRGETDQNPYEAYNPFHQRRSWP